MARGKDPATRYATAKGRKPTDRFARLGHTMLESAAYRALTPNARALLVELAMMEDGSNNGSLYLSVRDAADRIGVADPHTAGRAFDELLALGLIACTARAHFAARETDGSRSRVWRLAWQAVGGKTGPTNEYQDREPAPKTSSRRRMIKGQMALKRFKKERDEQKNREGKFRTLTTECVGNNNIAEPPPWGETGEGVQIIPTRNETNGANLPDLVVRNIYTHTATQLPRNTRNNGGQAGESQADHLILVDDPIAPLNGDGALLAMRDKITGHWKQLTPRRRRTWAESCGLRVDELRDFITGDPRCIPFSKLAAMVSAIREQGRLAREQNRQRRAAGAAR